MVSKRFSLIFVLYFCHPTSLQGWHDITIHCRSNDNSPMDWWYILKPPGIPNPRRDSGRNFSFIESPSFIKRWEQSVSSVARENMLINTLNPLFKATYTDHLAYLIFEAAPKTDLPGSTTHAVLMADEVGGLFILHTVPNLIDLSNDRFSYPQEALLHGHVFSCVSVDHSPLENLAAVLKNSGALVTKAHVPEIMQPLLPYWNKLTDPYWNDQDNEITAVEFVSEQQWLHGLVLTRRPGESLELYEEFAKNFSLVLDVYSPVPESKKRKWKVKGNFCNKDYGLRNIPSIVLKTKDVVEYINPNLDKTRFAVSTAAHWQVQGGSKEQYWTCIGNVNKEDPEVSGAALFCAENNHVWTNFDNLKVKEPKCGNSSGQ